MAKKYSGKERSEAAVRLRRERRKNKMKRRMIVFVFLFVCVGVIFTVLKAPFFNVKSIECLGMETVSEEKLIETAEAKIGVNIFTTNISAMKRRLAEMPEISESNVRRLFPNRLKIWVREAKKAGYVKVAGGYAVIDSKGAIIGTASDAESDSVEALAEITGLEIVSETAGQRLTDPEDMKAEKIFECMRIMEGLGLMSGVRGINAEDLSDIGINYEDRLNIYIGSYENMEYKLTFIKKVIDENISEYERADIDYRGDKVYVGPRADDTAAAQEAAESAKNENADAEGENKDAETKKDAEEKTENEKEHD